MASTRIIPPLLILVVLVSNIVIRVQAAPSGLNDDNKHIICYYSSWSGYRPGVGTFTIDDVPVNLCTHVVYAFIGLNNRTWELLVLDPTNDITKGGYRRFTSLKKRNPNLKTLISVGGWVEGGKKYSEMAAKADRRKIFVNSVVDFIKWFNFDGIDLDWEFPGSADRDGQAEDKANFLLLVKELRAAFDKEGWGWMLTAVVPIMHFRVHNGYDVAKLSTMLDHIHLLTYDLRGNWTGYSDIHTPLRPRQFDSGDYEGVNMHDGAELWEKLGAPKEKLTIGLALYGRTYTLADPAVNGLHSRLNLRRTAGNPGPYTKANGTLAYYEICEMQRDKGWEVRYDEIGDSPYMVKGDQWVGYDDRHSLVEKVKFVQEKGYGGVAIWSVDLDDFRGVCSEPRVLLNSIYKQMTGRSPFAAGSRSPTKVTEVFSSGFSKPPRRLSTPEVQLRTESVIIPEVTRPQTTTTISDLFTDFQPHHPSQDLSHQSPQSPQLRPFSASVASTPLPTHQRNNQRPQEHHISLQPTFPPAEFPQDFKKLTPTSLSVPKVNVQLIPNSQDHFRSTVSPIFVSDANVVTSEATHVDEVTVASIATTTPPPTTIIEIPGDTPLDYEFKADRENLPEENFVTIPSIIRKESPPTSDLEFGSTEPVPVRSSSPLLAFEEQDEPREFGQSKDSQRHFDTITEVFHHEQDGQPDQQQESEHFPSVNVSDSLAFPSISSASEAQLPPRFPSFQKDGPFIQESGPNVALFGSSAPEEPLFESAPQEPAIVGPLDEVNNPTKDIQDPEFQINSTMDENSPQVFSAVLDQTPHNGSQAAFANDEHLPEVQFEDGIADITEVPTTTTTAKPAFARPPLRRRPINRQKPFTRPASKLTTQELQSDTLTTTRNRNRVSTQRNTRPSSSRRGFRRRKTTTASSAISTAESIIHDVTDFSDILTTARPLKQTRRTFRPFSRSRTTAKPSGSSEIGTSTSDFLRVDSTTELQEAMTQETRTETTSQQAPPRRQSVRPVTEIGYTDASVSKIPHRRFRTSSGTTTEDVFGGLVTSAATATELTQKPIIRGGTRFRRPGIALRGKRIRVRQNRFNSPTISSDTEIAAEEGSNDEVFVRFGPTSTVRAPDVTSGGVKAVRSLREGTRNRFVAGQFRGDRRKTTPRRKVVDDYDTIDIRAQTERPSCDGNQKHYPHPLCDKYWLCTQGTATVKECEMGLLWNPQSDTCDWAMNVVREDCE